MIRPSELIERKRDGKELAGDEVVELVLGMRAETCRTISSRRS